MFLQIQNGVLTMTNPFRRGSAPERAQPAHLRPGSFKPGHKKRGGRRRGTPNAISSDYKKAILEAAYRVGNDGNGKDGVGGYIKWVGERHTTIFYTVLWIALLPLEEAETDAPEAPRRTMDELNQRFAEYIGLAGKKQTKRPRIQRESRSPRDWTGQPFPVGGLMQLAVANPKAFCELFVAAFLPTPTKQQRGRAARRAWEKRQRSGPSS
jgi:hypothetical protein